MEVQDCPVHEDTHQTNLPESGESMKQNVGKSKLKKYVNKVGTSIAVSKRQRAGFMKVVCLILYISHPFDLRVEQLQEHYNTLILVSFA